MNKPLKLQSPIGTSPAPAEGNEVMKSGNTATDNESDMEAARKFWHSVHYTFDDDGANPATGWHYLESEED